VINYWFFKLPSDQEQNQPMYYFRLLEPDFTPLPAYSALAEYTTSDAHIEPLPGWVFTWQWLRPFLFLISSTILFWGLLRFLSPKETGG
jgi:hypothetical protein